MNIQQQNLIHLIRCVLHNIPCTVLQEPDFSEITELAGRHKLAPFLFPAVHLIAQPLKPEIMSQWRHLSVSQTILEANQAYEYEQILQAMNQAAVHLLPVKGFAISAYYNNPHQRTVSDMDFLVDARFLQAAQHVMTELGYVCMNPHSEGTYQFFNEAGIHIELHSSLYEHRMPAASKEYLLNIFARAVPMDGYQTVYSLRDSDQYVYMMLHMYKHFIFAGTGIRSVLDIYFFRKAPLDTAYLQKKWHEFGITKFVECMEKLAACWFDGETPDALCQKLGMYISAAGVYGSAENKYRAMLRNGGKGGGKVRYFLRRIFLPYRQMAAQYAFVHKIPFLLPFAWLYRPIDAFLHRRSMLATELREIRAYQSEHTDDVTALMHDLEIF